MAAGPTFLGRAGVEKVSLAYRRTKRYMPADQEELESAIADGVEFRELLAPEGVKDGKLTCKVMELGAPDASGRRSPVDTGRTAEVDADTVIAAVGEKVNTGLYKANGLETDGRGRAVVDAGTLESSVKDVFVIGDGQQGPATVVEAIAGAAKAAQAIQPFGVDAFAGKNVNPDYQAPLAKRGDVCTDCQNCTDSRCLGCATACETCTEVCPNRANTAGPQGPASSPRKRRRGKTSSPWRGSPPRRRKPSARRGRCSAASAYRAW